MTDSMSCAACGHTTHVTGKSMACSVCASKELALCDVFMRPRYPPLGDVRRSHTVQNESVQQLLPAQRAPRRCEGPAARLPDEHFTRVPPWRKMGLKVAIEPAKEPRKPQAVCQLAPCTDFSKRGGVDRTAARAANRGHAVEAALEKEGRAECGSLGVECETHQPSEVCTVTEECTVTDTAPHSSSEEDVPAKTLRNKAGPACTSDDVALDVLPKHDTAHEPGPAEEGEKGTAMRDVVRACCRSRLLLVSLSCTCTATWAIIAATTSYSGLPPALVWCALAVSVLVHIAEGFLCEPALHLTGQPVSRTEAETLLERLITASPHVIWSVRNGSAHASGALNIAAWHDSTDSSLDLMLRSNLLAGRERMLFLKLDAAYAFANQATHESYTRQRRTFQARNGCRAEEEMRLHLQQVPASQRWLGFMSRAECLPAPRTASARSARTNAGDRVWWRGRRDGGPGIQLVVTETEQMHPLANLRLFWLCHLSVVLAVRRLGSNVVGWGKGWGFGEGVGGWE